jgi:hypothetical protein
VTIRSGSPRGRSRRAWLLLVVLGAGGCGSAPVGPGPSPTSEDEPCPRDGIDVELGIPSRGEEPALFTTAGGTVHVMVGGFPHGGVLDPEVWRSGIYVGDAAVPPTYDEQSSEVTGVVAQTSVLEGSWSSLELGPGRHWLWATNGAEVVLRSCEPGGLTDAVPAPGP